MTDPILDDSPQLSSDLFSIGNLYLAYRKSKTEAFYEKTHFHALAYTKFEQQLHKNLSQLSKRLNGQDEWWRDPAFIGDHAYLPKSVDTTIWESATDGHFRALDPKSDWQQHFKAAGQRANASLRLIIRPTVQFQIVSALWILRVGHLFDAAIDQNASFGNRLRRSRAAPGDTRSNAPGINLSALGLFSPYFSAYKEWREGGLAAMETAVENGENILAVTMDIEKFYHRVSPQFLIRPLFLKTIGLSLTGQETQFTTQLLAAISTWYSRTPDVKNRPEGGVPVGLSASKIIANALLAPFDKAAIEKLSPLYYGRYVDDIFLVLSADDEKHGAKHVTTRISEALRPMIKIKKNRGQADSLSLHLPYARDSELVFAGKKQKIFSLSSKHGADLIHHIRDQIRQQSSEYRLLPAVPSTGVAMASRALLATSNAALQADAVRKADVVSVRRLGFSLLLSDIETYAADLKPASWRRTREEFYELVQRHVITPVGFFDYFGYIPRVFGLMVCCGDFDYAENLIAEIEDVARLLERTTNLGKSDNSIFNLCKIQYAEALLETGLQAATMQRAGRPATGLLVLLKKLRCLSRSLDIPRTTSGLQKVIKQILLSDWGRRPYKDYWFHEQARDELGPKVPRSMEIRRQLRLGAIRRFRKSATTLKVPHWPALGFPTRPLRVDEIGLVAPAVLANSHLLRNAIKILRGAEVAADSDIGFTNRQSNSGLLRFHAGGRSKDVIQIAVTSIETRDKQWVAATKGTHDRSCARYENFNNLFNRILQEQTRPDYIVMPELCIPLKWALRCARKLATNGVSLIAGVEYHRDRPTRKLRNDCLVSLTTFWPGYASSLVVLQPKFAPAHGERDQLKAVLGKDGEFFYPKGAYANVTIYKHRGFFFSALICSDLTNVAHRNSLRGEIDALFALEWNPDVKTFSSLVEASANDLHAYIIQANNRLFGDSRIRAPLVQDYARDVVQIKGGTTDYYALGEIDVAKLRLDQLGIDDPRKFKPTPIGYEVGALRKN